MKKLLFIGGILFLGLILTAAYAQQEKSKIILLITEQNIASPQRAWWLSEIDLSITEATVAQKLMELGFEVIEPSQVTPIIEKNKAFRRLDLSEKESVKLGSLSQANYVILGKALASSGSKVPQSNMVSCFANINAKLIQVKDGKVIAYLTSSGNSVHLDVVTGGKEALTNAANDLAVWIIDVLSKQGGR